MNRFEIDSVEESMPLQRLHIVVVFILHEAIGAARPKSGLWVESEQLFNEVPRLEGNAFRDLELTSQDVFKGFAIIGSLKRSFSSENQINNDA